MSTMNEFEDYFASRRIADKTWVINTQYPGGEFSCDCYLVEGDEAAIAIDSSMSPLNIAEYMATLTDKPIIGVVNTHGHFDHVLGNGYFKHIYQSENAKLDKTPLDPDHADIWPSTEGIPLTYVADGYLLDLGGRILEVIEIGAHATGSIALLDKTKRILFSGDELESGWINCGSAMVATGKQNTIEHHYDNMRKLKSRYDEYDMICPGHHGTPLPKDAINDFLTLDRMIMNGEAGDHNVPKKCLPIDEIPGDVCCMRYKMAHICYSEARIFHHDSE